MIHSNTYKISRSPLRNSTGFILELGIEALPDMVLLLTADNPNDEDNLNTLQLTFSTNVSFSDTIHNYVDRFLPGAPLPQVQLTLLINNVDYSNYIISQVNITWGEDNSGTCSFTLKKIRPFSTIPVLTADSEIKVGSEVLISSVITLGENSFTHRLFTGNILSFDYDMWSDTVAVECLDKSFSISRLANKISQEFYNIDPYVTDLLTPLNVSSTYIIYKLSKAIDSNEAQSLIGLWLASDTTLTNNLLIDQPFNTFLFKEENKVQYFYIQRANVTGSLDTYLTANPNVAIKVRYAVSEEEQASLPITAVKKSAMVRQIAQVANIQDVLILRENMPEDEVTEVAMTANNEFPLDFIRKIIVPQTWRAYFDENGSLIVDREILRSTPNRTFTDAEILEGTLKITQDLDSVVNVQEVAGITIVQPSSTTTDSNEDIPLPNTSGKVCKDILITTVNITSGAAFTMTKQPSQSQLESCLVFYHTQLNTKNYNLYGGKILTDGIYFNLIHNDTVYHGNAGVTRYNHFGAFDITAKPRLFLSPMYFRLYNEYAGFNVNLPVIIQISGHTPALRESYDVSFSGLPDYASIQPKCSDTRFANGCVTCGGGIYKVEDEPDSTVGIAVTVLRPFTVNTDNGTVSVQTLNATLQIRALVAVSA